MIKLGSFLYEETVEIGIPEDDIIFEGSDDQLKGQKAILERSFRFSE